jgi:hypothetical protein
LIDGRCIYQNEREQKHFSQKLLMCAEEVTLHLGSNSIVDDDDNKVTLGASHSVPHPDYDP